MPQDYIPYKRNEYRTWLQHINGRAPVDGPAVGANAADVSAVVAQTEAQIALMATTENAISALKAARAAERAGKVATNKLLRKKFGQWKRMDNFTDAHGVGLKVVSRKQKFDPDTFKPSFTTRKIPGGIRLDWKKRGADGVFVFARLPVSRAGNRLAWTRFRRFSMRGRCRDLACPRCGNTCCEEW